MWRILSEGRCPVRFAGAFRPRCVTHINPRTPAREPPPMLPDGTARARSSRQCHPCGVAQLSSVHPSTFSALPAGPPWKQLVQGPRSSGTPSSPSPPNSAVATQAQTTVFGGSRSFCNAVIKTSDAPICAVMSASVADASAARFRLDAREHAGVHVRRIGASSRHATESGASLLHMCSKPCFRNSTYAYLPLVCQWHTLCTTQETCNALDGGRVGDTGSFAEEGAYGAPAKVPQQSCLPVFVVDDGTARRAPDHLRYHCAPCSAISARATDARGDQQQWWW